MVLTLILLLFSGWIAATISGAAGFGGALLLLPVLTNVLGVTTAVPVLTIGQLLGNGSRAWFGRTQISWRPVIYFIITAIPFSLLGSILFVGLPTRWITLGIGILLILIVIMRRLRVTSFNFGPKGLLIGGALTGFLSGLAGSAGPLGAAFFLGLDLPAVSYIASEAVTAITMHITKTIVYQKYALIGLREIGYGLFIGVGMILGSWTGRKIVERLSRDKFIIFVEILLIISAIQLIFFQ